MKRAKATKAQRNACQKWSSVKSSSSAPRVAAKVPRPPKCMEYQASEAEATVRAEWRISAYGWKNHTSPRRRAAVRPETSPQQGKRRGATAAGEWLIFPIPIQVQLDR